MNQADVIATTRFCRLKRGNFYRADSMRVRGNFGINSALALFFLALLISGMGYVYFMNKSAVKGFEFRSVEKKVAELKKENDKVDVSGYPKEHFINKIISAGDARVMMVGGDDALWERVVKEILPEVDEEDPLEQIRKTLDVTGRQ